MNYGIPFMLIQFKSSMHVYTFYSNLHWQLWSRNAVDEYSLKKESDIRKSDIRKTSKDERYKKMYFPVITVYCVKKNTVLLY